MTRQAKAAGYALGSGEIPDAPISLRELRAIEATATFDDADRERLRASLRLLEPHLDALVHDWMDFLLDHDHLNAVFRGGSSDDEIIGDYVDAVRLRLKAWAEDTAKARHDQDWLDYQIEIGRRLHRTKKNQTDRVDAAEVVPFRHLVPALVPFVTRLRTYLEQGDAPAEEVDRMLAAWTKSVTIQMSLWSRPYVGEEDH